MQKEMTVGYRLSPQQTRLWRLQQDDERQPYRVQCAILIEGNLDRRILKSALQNIVDRFEILRTSFYTPPSITLPVQVIAANPLWAMLERDLGALPADEQQAEIEALLQEQRRIPFNLEKECALHTSLLVLSASRQMLLVCLPALCADDTAPARLLHEIARAYAGLKETEAPDGVPMQYADFSEWHNELLESDAAVAARAYWGRQVKPESLEVHLPSEHHPDARHGFDPGAETLLFSAETSAKVQELAAKNSTPLSTFLLSCWQLLLWRLTGQPELKVGHACPDRKYEELEGALGLFTRYLPVGSQLASGMKLAQLLEQVSASIDEGYKWQEYFDWSLLAGSPDGATGSSFFPFGFDFAAQSEKRNAADLALTLSDQYHCIERFTLRLSCHHTDDRLRADFHYDRGCLGIGEVKRVMSQFEALLESIINNPEAPVDELEIISAAEARRLLFEFNDTGDGSPIESCAHELFEEQVERTPDNIALRFDDTSLTYQQLNQQANQLAHHLRCLGVGPETLVALCLERSAQLIIALLAVLKAGGAYLPLDITAPVERLRFMLDDTLAPVVLSQAHLAASLTTGGNNVISMDTEAAEWNSQPTSNPSPLALPDNLAYAIYTSGSTGSPKAVLIPHRCLVNYLSWSRSAYLPALGPGAPLHSSLAFDLCLTSLWLPLLSGTALTLLDERQGVAALVTALRQSQNYSLLKLTPAHLQLLATQLAPAELATAARRLVIGGEALLAEQLQAWREHAPQTRLINEYGPTETVVGCSSYEVRAEDAARGAVSIGRGISNTRLYVVSEREQLVGIGVVGELMVGGAGVGRGYHGRAEQTALAYQPDWLSGERGARLYRTGDQVRWSEEGQLQYVGRRDGQVKVRGYRVELGEIESVLREQRGVREAVVVARVEAGEGGEGGEVRQLVGYVVMESGAEMKGGELRRGLGERLPEVMVPWVYVEMEEMPLTGNGKVDRRALPPPGVARTDREDVYVPPRTRTEELLVGIWSEVLGIEKIGTSSSFFDLGGHSLLAMRIITRAREVFNVELSLPELFDSPDVVRLAELIENLQAQQEPMEVKPGTTIRRRSRDSEQQLAELGKLSETEAQERIGVKLQTS